MLKYKTQAENFVLSRLDFSFQSVLCLQFQLKPELIQLDVGKFGKKMKGVSSRDRGKEDHGEKEASSKQPEPTRIKIFEGGYVKICVCFFLNIKCNAFLYQIDSLLNKC